AGGPGGAKPEGELKAGEGAAKTEAELKQVDGKAKSEAELKEGEGKDKAEAELKPGEAKDKAGPEMGEAGGPKKPDDAADGEGGEEGSDLWQAKQDEELVDPDADRPDFGSVAASDEEIEDEFGDFDDAKSKKFERGKRDKAREINPAYLSAAVMTIAVVAIGATIWFGRGMLEDMWPGVRSFYEKFNAIAEKPSDGLRIAESGRRLTRIDGVETLVVRGFVSNVSQTVKPLPGMKLQLLNEKNEVIQESDNDPPAAMLTPGGSVEYEVRLELPEMDRASRYVVVWDE
ncbi:MAG: hypothetical protein KDA41_17665, partial [Planctomycetales bacterium]|nr:hypothetical protein [Planctomycetales bacterium]